MIKTQKLMLILTGVILTVFSIGGWYIFIAGAPQLDPPQIETHSELKFQLESFNSSSMQERRQYGVILPSDYHQHPERRYPVIFLLHGGHDNSDAYYKKYGIISVLDPLYHSGKLPPSIVIMPDGNDDRGSSPLWDPQYYDGSNGNIGTMIGSDLVKAVKSRYRTLSAPQFWAMGGISSGGWGAFNIGLRHLDQFSILFSHSGYFTDSSGTQNSPESFIAQIPITQLQRLHIYLDAGESDTELLASTQQFHQTLNQLGIANEFHQFPGGHGLTGADFGWNYFHQHLLDSLSYVGKNFIAKMS